MADAELIPTSNPNYRVYHIMATKNNDGRYRIEGEVLGPGIATEINNALDGSNWSDEKTFFGAKKATDIYILADNPKDGKTPNLIFAATGYSLADKIGPMSGLMDVMPLSGAKSAGFTTGEVFPGPLFRYASTMSNEQVKKATAEHFCADMPNFVRFEKEAVEENNRRRKEEEERKLKALQEEMKNRDRSHDLLKRDDPVDPKIADAHAQYLAGVGKSDLGAAPLKAANLADKAMGKA